jgi:8-oxo-dGTP pyrophosphatase MutT (NUDIX family)
MVDLRDAATVILVRETDATENFETFLLKRSGKSSFMAHARVYPGGTLDDADLDPDVREHVTGRTPANAASVLAEPEDRALGLYLAAIRETFEESGVLLAHRRGKSTLIDFCDEPRWERYRRELHQHEIALSTVAEREDLTFPLERLAYFAHWITPYFESKRFDTHFFVARMPEAQSATHDAVETTEAQWLTPAAALKRNAADPTSFYLAPPTLRTLEQLADFDSVESLFEFCDGRRPPTILPHFEPSDAGMVLMMPGDDAFPADDERYAMCTEVDDGVTRMIMGEDGVWRSIR